MPQTKCLYVETPGGILPIQCPALTRAKKKRPPRAARGTMLQSRRARNSRRIVRKCKGPLQLQRPFNFAAKCGLCPLFLLAAGLGFLAWA